MTNLAQPHPRARVRVATLGPRGTCSEHTALGMLWASGESIESARDCVLLTSTFEDAIHDVIVGEADRALVPAAYKNYNEIAFSHVGQLQVIGVVTSPTPVFVLAGRRHSSRTATRLSRIASHPSPAPLLSRVAGNFVRVDALSNAAAAWMVINGEADLCITNRFAVEAVNGAVDAGFELVELQMFGSVEMVWAVLGKKRPDGPIFMVSLGLEDPVSEGGER